jgi:protein TonB
MTTLASNIEEELRTQRRIETISQWVIIGTLLISLGVHAAMVWAMPKQVRPAEKARPIEVKMNFEEEQKKKTEPEPPPPPPPPKRKVVLPPPPNQEAPPPEPNQPPPELVVGVTAESVGNDGPAVQVGNTMYGEGATKAVDSASVKAYTGPSAPPAVVEPKVLQEWTDGAYPEEARENNIEGIVRLQITISAEGYVTNVVVVKGLGFGLDEEAKRRIKKYRFAPATRDGQPVATTIPFNFRFVLED